MTMKMKKMIIYQISRGQLTMRIQKIVNQIVNFTLLTIKSNYLVFLFFQIIFFRQSELEVERNVPESSILVEKYLTRTLFYNEVAIAGVLKQFYLRDFSSSSITSLLYNPISGPQLIDGIFFLLLFPQLDKFAQELLPTNDFLVGLGSKQLFEKNYLMFYENAMNLFKQEILNVTSNYDLLAYFTYDSAHWKYLPQLSFIRRLKEITNFKQISGLQTLLRLYGENFKYENIMDNANHKDIIKEITDFI